MSFNTLIRIFNQLSWKENLSILLLLTGVSGLLLKMFDIITLVYISIIIYSSSMILYLSSKRLKKYGLISILPYQIKYFLLKKSILDILMDFWHLPSITKYFKFLFVPIIYNYSPEESIEAMKELDNKTLKNIQTKVSL